MDISLPKGTFVEVDRNRLYFNRYQFCLRLVMPEVSAMRYLDHGLIDHYIEMRKRWNLNTRLAPVFRWRPVTVEDQENLHKLCDFFLADQRDRKTMIASDLIYIYTNDHSLIRDIIDLQFTVYHSPALLTKVNLRGVPEGVNLKTAKYKFRTYLRGMALSDNSAHSVRTYISAQQDVRLSPALKHWVSSNYRRTMDYFFIDHDHLGAVDMLNLIQPRLIRKTQPKYAYK